MWPDVPKNLCRNRLMIILLLFTCLMISATSSAIMGDECDWTGSGLTSSSPTSRGVTPVYLRCSAGRVTWMYPEGALRVLLRYPGQGREFRACIKVRSGDEHKDPNVRLFLEGPRSLLPLYSYNDGSSKAIRCFSSKNGQVAIYVEATQGQSVNKRTSEIEYDLQPLPKGVNGYDPTEECRPCTSSELAHAFCTSDLVTRGTIYSVENKDEEELSQLSIKVTKMIRHTVNDIYSPDLETNSVYDEGEKIKEVVLHVSQHCGVTHGEGEFVFMARSKLGDLTLQCAPRLEDWAQLVNQLSEDGTAHCVLRS